MNFFKRSGALEAPTSVLPEQEVVAASLRLRRWLRAFFPAPMAVNGRERWRAFAGALLGVLLTALICRWLAATPGVIGTWLLAPLGASTVLVFAAPASPLAQPWSVVGGNTVSALVGFMCAALLPDPMLAGPLAVALAIVAMFGLRCLHPPGGAMALSGVLAHAAHAPFAPSTALVNSALLVGMGVVYNLATGRRYPHSQAAPKPKEAAGARFKSEDLDAVLARYNQVLDVSRDDLETLLQEAEMEGYRRRVGEVRCREVMTRNVMTVEFGASLQEAWQIMRDHHIKALPVVDRCRRVVGIVTMADFLRAARIDGPHHFRDRLREFIRPDGLTHSDKPEVVGQIMTRQVRVTSEDRHAVELMPLFTEAGHHHIPVIDHDKRLVGMITQSDFVRALYQTNA